MNILIKTGITIGLLFGLIHVVSAEKPDLKSFDIISKFLETDTTDDNEYLPYYTCGHFSRELAHNASKSNLTIGSAIVGYHPTFKGFGNHIMNYGYIDGEIYFIEPQTDQIQTLDDVHNKGYQYIRLYPDGSSVPTYWRYNLAPTITGKPI